VTGLGFRQRAKVLAGRLPWAPELYQDWIAGGNVPATGYTLARLERELPGWVEAVEAARAASRVRPEPRRVLVVGYLTWWLEFAVALGLVLASQGHEVHLGFLPFRRWTAAVDPFDLRRQRAYLRQVLRAANRLIRPFDLSRPAAGSIPAGLAESLARLALTDVEYTFQREAPDLTTESEANALLSLRRSRDETAARNALRLFDRVRYDAVVVPNGSILEFGAVYRTARARGLPTVTYEFGEQRGRMWVCRDGEAMRLETTGLWRARGEVPLTEIEQTEVEQFFRARRGGVEWRTFGRLWQRGQRQGARLLRESLGLDDVRPVVLLATNVVGDSLALNRQVFTRGMADWLSHTLRLLAGRTDVQLVVRVHPGELLGAGLTSEEIVRRALPEVPSHVRLVGPESELNTYDLIENAHLGLVYTSTVGLEMAMHGVPVITAGRTHYRGKGFTDDPESLDDYARLLEHRLSEPRDRRLDQAQVDLAWRYAHRFFFEYPFSFPWHLLHFWEDMAALPLGRLVRSGEMDRYGEVLGVMAGRPIDWDAHASAR
jgi:hypothetical protein